MEEVELQKHDLIFEMKINFISRIGDFGIIYESQQQFMH
jgi:hypothetical protein